MQLPNESTLSWRWRLAGRLRTLPEFRGRDRLEGLIRRGAPLPSGAVRCVIGPNLVFDARMQDDGSWIDLFFLQYEPPALTPVIETFLRPGSSFVDVGANIGIYTAWASRLVGPTGRVLSFEPVPATRQDLESVIKANQLENVTVVAKALGAESGEISLWVTPRASGLTTALPPAADSPARRVDVVVARLDDEIALSGLERLVLVKIDVEGLEMSVLRGATRALASKRPPAVVFETDATHLARAGVRFSDVVSWFESQFGFRLFGLLPAGLKPISRGSDHPPAGNTLALHPETHRLEYERLRRFRFRRNQSC